MDRGRWERSDHLRLHPIQVVRFTGLHLLSPSHCSPSASSNFSSRHCTRCLTWTHPETLCAHGVQMRVVEVTPVAPPSWACCRGRGRVLVAVAAVPEGAPLAKGLCFPSTMRSRCSSLHIQHRDRSCLLLQQMFSQASPCFFAALSSRPEASAYAREPRQLLVRPQLCVERSAQCRSLLARQRRRILCVHHWQSSLRRQLRTKQQASRPG
mmetsp:Transcript_30958/g.100906  ORF Transcript_30958/g.100906 Transcript_30958/m.100906 type:complete len:210 (-) Transcript_30958:150-779(-)